MTKSKISYLRDGYTWNPVERKGGGYACTPVSIGCDHCWASELNNRFNGGRFSKSPSKINFELNEKVLLAPTTVKKPSIFGVQFRGDLFHEDVPFKYIQRMILETMMDCRRHTFLILTKRPERMGEFLKEVNAPNVWLGVSVENEDQIRRAYELAIIPAAHRWLSLEPLLGPIDLRPLFLLQQIEWVVVGCESGPGHRPMNLDWVRSLRDQCQAAKVPFYFKQAYERHVHTVAGLKVTYRDKLIQTPALDGVHWRQRPW